MKLRFTSTLFILSFFCFLFMSHSGGRATQFAEGNTGAPGDDSKTCASCHSGGNFGAEIEIKLIDDSGSEVTTYLGGETYTVQATVTTTSTANGYGLQMVSLIDDNEQDTQGLSNPSANANIASAGGRNYLEQKGLSASETFTAQWTAPATGAGSVSFYAAGHASNANGNTTGDDPTTGSVTIEEFVVSTDESEKIQFSVFPNPVDNYTTISWDEQKDVTVSVYSLTGQVISAVNVQGTQVQLDLAEANAGVYFVSIVDNDTRIKNTKKLIKR